MTKKIVVMKLEERETDKEEDSEYEYVFVIKELKRFYGQDEAFEYIEANQLTLLGLADGGEKQFLIVG